jgi:hypothetical protein
LRGCQHAAHRSLFQDNGKFDESFHIAADYELLLRELITRDALFIDNLVTVNMERGGDECQSGELLPFASGIGGGAKKERRNVIFSTASDSDELGMGRVLGK